MHAGDVGHTWLSSRDAALGCWEYHCPGPSARDSPCLLGSGLGAQRVPSPPAAAWPGRQPLPGQAPCSLMADMPSPVQSLSWDGGKTISGRNCSPPVRLFFCLKYCKQDTAASTLSLGTGQFLSRCLCSVGIPIKCGGHGHNKLRAA